MQENRRVERAQESDTSYDVIFIGSGIGSLAAASFLARLGKKRVLILERHFKIGGFTHIFKRKEKYLWDVGIHYIGNLEEGSMIRNIFDAITARGVSWHKMPHIFEKFVYPDFTFALPSDPKEFEAKLIREFPKEESAIRNYFKDIEATANWFGRHITMKMLPSGVKKVAHLLNLVGKGNALMTTGDYMQANFSDPRLRAILCSQWGDYGLPPGLSAFVIHALVVSHYLQGGWYPVGGSANLAASVLPWIRKHGGEALVDHTVDEILLEDGKAVGVRCRHITGKRETLKEFRAPIIVSNAGALHTYNHFLPRGLSADFRSELEAIRNGVSCVTLYLGLGEDPRSLGFEGENHWIFSDLDHDSNFENRNGLLEGRPGGAFLSFPSLKDPEAEGHTAEIIAFCDYEPFARWADKPWMKRGEDYLSLKERITEGLLDFVEERYPGFRRLIDYKELATPLTTRHFSNHISGSIYGLGSTPDRYASEWLGIQTPVQNLYLVGADASSPGVAGAMMSGVAAAAHILGLKGMMRLFRNLKPMAEGEF